jgi:hypothetical protein
MNYNFSDISDEVDPHSAVAASHALTFRFKVLIASLKSKTSSAALVLVVLGYATVGAFFLYFNPKFLEILSAAVHSLLPSLFVILVFAFVSTAHYLLTLLATLRQAYVALELQQLAQKNAEFNLEERHYE